MRVFFLIDEKSRVSLKTMRALLELAVPRQLYELLPIQDSCFPCPRSARDELFQHAKREGEKILRRYADTRLCVVVVAADFEYQGTLAPVDYGITVRPVGDCTYKILNPPTKPKHFRISSPRLQPVLTEAAIELGEFEPLP